MECLFDDCITKPNKRGYCRKHYRLLLGTEVLPRKRKENSVERFWSNVTKTDNCWEWIGFKADSGHGYISVNDNMVSAYGFSYKLHGFIIPKGKVLDHECLNYSCVNPEHLRPVTRQQNNENYVKPLRSHNKSGHRGVFWNLQKSKWQAKVQYLGKQYHGGFFDDIELANAKAIELRNQLHTHNDQDRVISHAGQPT